MIINEKHKREVENRGYIYIGTYERYELLENNKISNYHIRVKCPYCKKEYDIQRYSFVNKKANCEHCCNKYENSIAYYIEQDLGLNLEEVTDIKLCEKHPKFIYKKSREYIYLWWNDKYKKHSYKIRCYSFIRTNKYTPKRSIADYIIEQYGEDALKLYWSDKNIENPWEINYGSDKKYWFKCQGKDYHEDYLSTPNNFTNAKSRCPYCNNKKVHTKDSLGYLHSELISYWSKDNEESIFKVSPHSNKEYKWICEDCGCEFERIVNNLNLKLGVRCSKCQISQGEYIIKEFLNINNIEYIHQKKFENLIGLKNGLLSYDFYLPKYNLLIEYQGEFHDGSVKTMTKEKFESQQEHDKRKREYAKKHNIELLEIWYYDKDNIENILNKYVEEII